MKGWIFDVGADNEKNCMVVWMKGENGAVEKFECTFDSSFYVHSAPEHLHALEQTFEGDPFITSMGYEEKRLWPGEPKKEVLKISLSDYRVLTKLANEIDEMGDFSLYELFNVDLSIPTAFMLKRDMVPTALGEFNDTGDFTLLEDLASLDYPIPDLRSVELSIDVKAADIPRWDDQLSKIHLDGKVIEGKDERGMLIHLIEELRAVDPDIIYTSNGDSFVIPYLTYRAELNEFRDFYMGPGAFLPLLMLSRRYTSPVKLKK